MKPLAPALDTHLRSRTGIDADVLIWIEAVDRVTGDPAPFGLWTGDDDRTFTIDGGPRTYLGAGSLIDVGDLVSEVGYVVRITRMTISHLAPRIAEKLAEVEVRLQPCTWHQVHLVPGSHDLVAEPRRVFRGRVERLSLPDAAQGRDAAAEIELASYAREMTHSLPLKKSDEALQARHPGDRFRQYIAVSGRVTTSWGEGAAQPAPFPPLFGKPSNPGRPSVDPGPTRGGGR